MSGAQSGVLGRTAGRRILGATALIGLITIGVKALSLAKEMVVASTFGVGATLDAFLLAFAVPSFAVTVLAGSLGAAFVPTYVRVREHRPQEAHRLMQSALALALALLTATTLLLVLTAPFYLPWFCGGLDARTAELALNLTRALAPLILLQGLKSVWAAALHARERFAWAAFAPALTPIAICLVLAVGGWSANGMLLALGVVAGSGLECVVLAAAARRRGISLRPRWHGLNPEIRRVLGQYLPCAAGAVLLGAAPLIDRAMATELGAGGVSALVFGSRLAALPIGLGALALGTAALPTFSKLVARADWGTLRPTVRRLVAGIVVCSAPVVAVLVIWSEDWIRLVYERGAFEAADSTLVARVQVCFALQIPFHVAGVLFARLLASVMANRVLFAVSGASVVLNVVLNLAFMPHLGVAGIALSTSCVYLASFLAMAGWWWKLSRREP